MKYLDKLSLTFWAHVSKGNLIEACWSWKGAKSESGYGLIGIRVDKKAITQRAHRVSYAIHNVDFNQKLSVLHSCDNPECCNPLHLFLGTQQDNMSDMAAKDRTARQPGEKNGSSKLTEEQVLEIYSRRGYETSVDLAAAFNVSNATISYIWTQKRWKYLTTSGTPDRKTHLGLVHYK